MKQIKKLIMLAAITMGNLSYPMLAEAEPLVAFDQSTVRARVGEIITLQLVLSDFPTTQGGGVNLQFNPENIRVLGVTVDKQWNFSSQLGIIDNQKGQVSDILFSQFNGIGGELDVARIEIEVIHSGGSLITLSESKKNPFSGQGKIIDVSFGKMKITARKR